MPNNNNLSIKYSKRKSSSKKRTTKRKSSTKRTTKRKSSTKRTTKRKSSTKRKSFKDQTQNIPPYLRQTPSVPFPQNPSTSIQKPSQQVQLPSQSTSIQKPSQQVQVPLQSTSTSIQGNIVAEAPSQKIVSINNELVKVKLDGVSSQNSNNHIFSISPVNKHQDVIQVALNMKDNTITTREGVTINIDDIKNKNGSIDLKSKITDKKKDTTNKVKKEGTISKLVKYGIAALILTLLGTAAVKTVTNNVENEVCQVCNTTQPQIIQPPSNFVNLDQSYKMGNIVANVAMNNIIQSIQTKLYKEIALNQRNFANYIDNLYTQNFKTIKEKDDFIDKLQNEYATLQTNINDANVEIAKLTSEIESQKNLPDNIIQLKLERDALIETNKINQYQLNDEIIRLKALLQNPVSTIYSTVTPDTVTKVVTAKVPTATSTFIPDIVTKVVTAKVPTATSTFIPDIVTKVVTAKVPISYSTVTPETVTSIKTANAPISYSTVTPETVTSTKTANTPISYSTVTPETVTSTKTANTPISYSTVTPETVTSIKTANAPISYSTVTPETVTSIKTANAPISYSTVTPETVTSTKTANAPISYSTVTPETVTSTKTANVPTTVVSVTPETVTITKPVETVTEYIIPTPMTKIIESPQSTFYKTTESTTSSTPTPVLNFNLPNTVNEKLVTDWLNNIRIARINNVKVPNNTPDNIKNFVENKNEYALDDNLIALGYENLQNLRDYLRQDKYDNLEKFSNINGVDYKTMINDFVDFINIRNSENKYLIDKFINKQKEKYPKLKNIFDSIQGILNPWSFFSNKNTPEYSSSSTQPTSTKQPTSTTQPTASSSQIYEPVITSIPNNKVR